MTKEIGLKFTAQDADRFNKALDAASKATRELADSLNATATTVNRWEQVAQGAAERVGHVLVDMAVQAGQALVQFATDGVTAAGNFEAGMNRFASVTGSALEESGQSLEDFSNLFLQMGQDTQYSAQQAQDAAINLAKGGIDPATISAGGLKAALDLAAAGEVDLAEAAEITAKQYGVWVSASASAGEKAAFLADSANLMAQAANASVVNVDDLAVGLAQAGGAAKNAGATFRETVTSIALISPSFSSASDAGTSFKTFMARLIPSTENATEAMVRLGLATEGGKSKFYDANGQFIGMKASAELLKNSLKGLSDAQRNSALQAIFGADAIRTAAKLAEEGADGYERMAQMMLASGSAAEQAAARNQGFNFALDQARGSLETLQIVLFSTLLPALTAVLADGVVPLVNGITTFVQATEAGQTWLSALADIITTGFVPALVGATAAMIAYGVATASTATPALITLLTTIGSSIAAFGAQAAVIGAAIAPYALIAAAVGGVVLAYQGFEEKIQSSAQTLLNSRQWWTDSTLALEAYKQANLEITPALQSAVSTLEILRQTQEAEIESLGRRKAAGVVSEQQYAAEMGVINQRAEAIKQATAHLTALTQAEVESAASALTATSAMATMNAPIAELTGIAALSTETLQKLGEQLEQIFAKGAQAVGTYVQTEATFLTSAEGRRQEYYAKISALVAEREQAQTEEQKKEIDRRIAETERGYKEQEAAQAESYARQAAAQRQALGEQLVAYVENQRQLGNITSEQASAITGILVEQYGIARDSSVVLFGEMASAIDSFASNSSGSLTGLGESLNRIEKDAVDTRIEAERLAKDYTIRAVDNFAEAKSDARAYADELKRIPSRVETEVHTRYTSSGSTTGRDDAANTGRGRALGGPVAKDESYIVGERGPELFVPRTSGLIVPNNQISFAGEKPNITPELLKKLGLDEDAASILIRVASGEQVREGEDDAGLVEKGLASFLDKRLRLTQTGRERYVGATSSAYTSSGGQVFDPESKKFVDPRVKAYDDAARAHIDGLKAEKDELHRLMETEEDYDKYLTMANRTGLLEVEIAAQEEKAKVEHQLVEEAIKDEERLEQERERAHEQLLQQHAQLIGQGAQTEQAYADLVASQRMAFAAFEAESTRIFESIANKRETILDDARQAEIDAETKLRDALADAEDKAATKREDSETRLLERQGAAWKNYLTRIGDLNVKANEELDAAEDRRLSRRASYLEQLDALEQKADDVRKAAEEEKARIHAEYLKKIRALDEEEVYWTGVLASVRTDIERQAVEAKIADVRAEKDAVTAGYNEQIGKVNEATDKKLGAIETEKAAATTNYNKQISEIDKATEKRLGAIETEKEARLKDYNNQIQELQNAHAAELTAIKDQLTKEQRARQADYELQNKNIDLTKQAKLKALDDELAAAKRQRQQDLIDLARTQAQQRAMQRKALGEQLIAATQNRVALGDLNADVARAIIGDLRAAFGVAEDPLESILSQFDAKLKGASWAAIDPLIRDTFLKVQSAGEKELIGLKVLDQNLGHFAAAFERGELDFAALVERYTESFRGLAGRALGGPVDRDTPYLVGEDGPEVFIPRTAGMILPAQRSAPASLPVGMVSPPPTPQQIASSTTNYNGGNTTNYHLSVATQQQSQGIVRDFYSMRARAL